MANMVGLDEYFLKHLPSTLWLSKHINFVAIANNQSFMNKVKTKAHLGRVFMTDHNDFQFHLAFSTLQVQI